VIWDFKKDYLNAKYIALQKTWNTSFSLKLAIIFLIELVLIIFLSVTKIEIFPDLFGVYKIENKDSYFDLIVGSLSSLSGILIAVFLIAFEILKQKLGESVNEHFFKNKNLMFVLFLFIITITSAFISKFIHSSLDQNNMNNLMYLNAILFMLSIVTIIPSSLSILFSLKHTRVIKELVEEITFGEIMELSQTPSYLIELSNSQNIDSLPFSKLRSIAKKNMNNERAISKFIVTGLTHKLSEEMKKNIDSNGKLGSIYIYNRRPFPLNGLDFFMPYYDLLKDLSKEALKDNDIEFIKHINHNTYMLFTDSVNEKIDFIELQGFKRYIESHLEELIKYNQTDVVLELNWQIIDIISKILKKYAPLTSFRSRNSENFIRLPLKGLEYSSKHEKNDIFRYLSSSISSIIQNIDKSEIPNNKKNQMISFIRIDHISAITNELSKGNTEMKYIADDIFVSSWFIQDLIERDDASLKKHLQQLGNYIIDLHKGDLLYFWSLVGFGIYGNRLIEKYSKSQNIKNGFEYVLNVLMYIKKELKRDLKKNSRLYLQIQERINSYIDTSVEYGIPELTEKLKRIEKSFKRVPKTDWINGDGYIEWGVTNKK